MKGCLTKRVRTEVANLTDTPQMDERAAAIMECFKGKVSPTLFGMLCEMVYGFRSEIQRRMAENLLYFVNKRVATTTGRLDVDTVLEVSYVLIGAEKGFAKKGITNLLAASKLIELAERKTRKEERARINVELPRVKNVRGIEVRKSCSTCPFRRLKDNEKDLCEKLGVYVMGTDRCSGWKMAPCYAKVGTNKGRVKSKAYLDFILKKRLAEDEEIELGVLTEADRQPVKEIRKEYEEKYGSIYM